MIDPLSELPGYALRRAANKAAADLAERLKPLGLRQAEYSALVLIEANPGLTSSRLGEALSIQRANMVPFIGRMETAGLLSRKPIDGRTQAIHLTALGQSRLEQAHGVIAQFEADLIARVPEPHRAHFLPALLAIWS